MPRKTKYNPDFDKQACELCLMGATDDILAEFFQVHKDTINEWKRRHKSFSDSLRRGKLEADSQVAAALYKRALGFKIEERLYEDGVLHRLTKKELPPDTGAIKMWLSNRQPLLWREFDFRSLSPDELDYLFTKMQNLKNEKSNEK
jgi:hypothetical protein